MKYKIIPDDKTPAYMQLYIALKNDIVCGRYPTGAKLPSKRILSEEVGVSVITTEHAYAILCDEGYVEAAEKKGYFVIYRKGDAISERGAEHTPLNTTELKNNDEQFPFSTLAKTMRKVLLDYNTRLMMRSPNHGLDELRTAVSDYLGRSQGIYAEPTQIIIGSGAEYFYNIVVQLFGTQNLYAVESPSYKKISQVYISNGVKLDYLPLGKNGIPSDALNNTAAKVLHVTPFHSFPSGVSADASKRREYVNWANANDAYIIEDNYDSEMTVSSKNEEAVFSLSEQGRVIYINTFSRTIAPSLRAGYMVLSPKLLKLFEQKLDFYSCSVPVFEQYVLTELLDGGEFERHVNRIRRARRKALS